MQSHSGGNEHASTASSVLAKEDCLAEEADSAYVDKQWRHITLASHDGAWTDRLQSISIAASRAGMLLLPDPG